MGECIGTVEMLSPDKSSVKIRPFGSGIGLSNGDGFCFVSRGREVIGFRGDICDGLTIKCKPVPELFEKAILYRNIDTAFEKKLETEMPSRYIDVMLEISADTGILHVKAETEDGRLWNGTLGENADPAMNPVKMRETVISQLSKTTGHYRFSANPFTARQMPFLPVSAVNAFRRKIAEELDKSPCNAKPLHISDNTRRPVPQPGILREMSSYKANIANSEARKLVTSLGAERPEPAYEIDRKPDTELMRTKYCIRYQFGKCPKYHKEKWPEKLFLENNGQLFSLHFDCRNCEMAVKSQPSPLFRK